MSDMPPPTIDDRSDGINVRAFCVPGKHVGPVVSNLPTAYQPTPKGWRLVRARFDEPFWLYDPTSPARIMVCPVHRVTGED